MERHYLTLLRGPSNTIPDTNGWKDRHLRAIQDRQPIAVMLAGWARYADEHRERFESSLGDDRVLGPMWAAIGSAILGLLNGETGDLDCGTLDAFIRNTMIAEGVNLEDLS
jgi:hypothetical protein